MPVNLFGPFDEPFAPLFPQFQQSYPVEPFAPAVSLDVSDRLFSPPGYNGLKPPRVTPQVPAAKVPLSSIDSVTASILYNNVNYSSQPKLNVAGSMLGALLVDPRRITP